MYSKIVNMYDLIFCITNTGDMISNEISNHHKKVAYLAFRIAEKAGLSHAHQREVFLAGLMHDIGAFSTQERLNLLENETPNMHDHAFIGAHILQNFKPLTESARMVRFHHVPWNYGEGESFQGMEVPLASHILHLADRIVVLMDMNKEIIGQADWICGKIKEQSGKLFMPELVEHFLEISQKEHIWLDMTYEPLLTVMPSMMNFESYELTLNELISLSEIFANMIDFRSPFTANHSFGVAAVAKRMAELAGFSANECKMMQIAGYLHDLGKLAINNAILEKPGKLDDVEFIAIRSHTFYTYRTLQVIKGFETINRWASFHHERLSGEGYPFHLKAEEIPLGSRIMAVADVFTAITEDRPYRKGMLKNEVEQVFRNMVSSNALCPYAVSILEDNIDMLNEIRDKAQKKAGRKYKYISSIHIDPYYIKENAAINS